MKLAARGSGSASACGRVSRRQVGIAGVEAAVDEHHARRRDAGQQRWIEGGRRDRGRREAAPLERAQRGVFPGFAAGLRQAVAQGLVERGAAGGVGPGDIAKPGRQRVQQRAHGATAAGATRSLSQA
jgi:hypothetical protein